MSLTLPPVDRDALVATRRDLHQHPELGFQETRTSTLVAERLQSLGYQVKTGVGQTGVVAVKRVGGGGSGGGQGKCVMLRADMDALPVEEANELPYKSTHPGRMHACGHDGHVAIGLEVARRLASLSLPGAVKFAFQPAEEISNGAQAMIRDGVLDAPKVDAAFGIHLWNDLPVGTIGIMPGPVMASVDEFEITILGRGGHAAAPHQTIDPVLIAAHVVTGLQSLVSRRRNPFEEGVVSVTQVSAGHAFNVIPGRADLRGTVRTFGGKFFEEAQRLVEEAAQGIAGAFGASAEVRYRRLSGPMANDEKMTALMKDVGEEIVGKERVIGGVRTMGGEDMSYFLRQVPGCFAFVGSAPPGKKASPHHSPTFDIDEDALPIGAELLARTAVRYLEQAQ
ncbi:MAG: amidohydrolase [Gemmatimonadetes bacterium]|nr:MAG: amidohydrolase [Gemmatimonadota bacterium]